MSPWSLTWLSGIRLDRLHLVFQAALGWTNSHLCEVRDRDTGCGMVNPDWGDGPLDANKSRLADVLEDVGAETLRYLYDFGDGWEHTVKVERVANAIPGLPYPILLDAMGRCPPQDVGSPSGYSDRVTRSQTQATSVTMNWPIGSAVLSILSNATAMFSQKPSMILRGNGRQVQISTAKAPLTAVLTGRIRRIAYPYVRPHVHRD